jgi:internalin A
MASELELLKRFVEAYNIELPQRDFQVMMQGGSSYALDEHEQVIGLNLHNLELETLPTEVLQLEHLRSLSLYNNCLTAFPTALLDCTQLQQLSLSRNQIATIPDDIVRLKNLRFLDLTANRLKRLPETILELGLDLFWEEQEFRLEGVILQDNPLESPPVEIIKQGRDAIRVYFDNLAQPQPLNEVKVLLVGEGGAGKTSLVKRLLGEAFDADESQTHGITITPWQARPSNEDITVHFWDFGGQEIMHATHQFFLSKRSLYILVLDSRREERAEYWLKHIESFGGNSPILVVLNKIDEHPGFDVNRKFLQQKYPGIQGFCRLSCATGEGLEAFHAELCRALLGVECLHTLWPRAWFRVKAELETTTADFISYESYQAMCQRHGVTEPDSQDTLLRFLHDLGVTLHFPGLRLEHTYVLEPRWLTGGAYKIINSPQLADQQGLLALDSLPEILRQQEPNDPFYPRDKYPFIIELMKRFELCYELEGAQTILVPDLLPVQEPAFDFDDTNALQFVLQYDFLPRAIMPRFIVKRHREIQDDLRWRTGVVLEDLGFYARAVVRVDHEARRILIAVSGSHQKRDYLVTMLKTFREIHRSFEKLACDERVCLPDQPELTVSYQHLLRLEKMGQHVYIPEGASRAYQVKDLLGMVVETRTSQEMFAILRQFRTEVQGVLREFGRRFQDANTVDDRTAEDVSAWSSGFRPTSSRTWLSLRGNAFNGLKNGGSVSSPIWSFCSATLNTRNIRPFC